MKKKKIKIIVRSDDFIRQLAYRFMKAKFTGGLVDEDELMRSRSETGRTILHMLAETDSKGVLDAFTVDDLFQTEKTSSAQVPKIQELVRIRDRVLGFTPVHAAARCFNISFLRKLLKLDKDTVNIVDNRGFTPLMHVIGVDVKDRERFREEDRIKIASLTD